MSRGTTLTRLGLRNAIRGKGRLVILAVLLASALVARSASSLTLDSLVDVAAATVTEAAMPTTLNTMAFFSEPFGPEWCTDQPLKDYLGTFLWMDSPSFEVSAYKAAYFERYLGPGGSLTLVRPAPETNAATGRYVEASRPTPWATDLVGKYPNRPDQVAVPAPLARKTGLAPGSRLDLTPEGGGPTVVFTVTGVYTPLGHGPFYEFLLSARDETKPPAVNLVIIGCHEELAWYIPAIYGSDLRLVRIEPPDNQMRTLARSVYATRSTASGIGFALVGVAVLVVLLVAMVERRREAASYKLTGMSSLATLQVLLVELSVALALAVVLAVPAYRLAVSRLLVDVQGLGLGAIVTAFTASCLWTAAIATLGASYPFCLTMVGTPNALLSGQRIYLFRRKHVLGGWVQFDTERQ
jgi:hypothetical protein